MSLYTPEYSEELLSLVTELYSDEIKPHLNELRLLKMLDLMEMAQADFEQYKKSLIENSHIKCLKNYIVGLFLVFLVIPQSIQFQIKNKNYELFLSLKQLYERETHMSNVKLQVVDYIAYISESKQRQQQQEHEQKVQSRKHRQASTSGLHGRTLSKDHRSSTMPAPLPTLDQDFGNLRVSEHNSSTTSQSDSAAVSINSGSTNSSIVEEVWSPPELQPKDQLKLADGYDVSLDSLVPELPAYPPPTPPRTRKHALSFPMDPEALLEDRRTPSPGPTASFAQNHIFQSKASRRESYNSVYAEDSYENVAIISPKQLYQSLLDTNIKTLIFDIRPSKKYQKKHIPYKNIINLDPVYVEQSEYYAQLEETARTSLSPAQFAQFHDMDKFDQVVYYSDGSTSLVSELDFLEMFDTLLKQRKIHPKLIEGGFESWTKFLSRENIINPDFKSNTPAAPLHPPPASTDLSPRSTPQQQDQQQQIHLSKASSNLVSYLTPSGPAPPIPPPHLMTVKEQNEPVAPYPSQYYYTTTPYTRPAIPAPQPQRALVSAPPSLPVPSIPQYQQYQQHPQYQRYQPNYSNTIHQRQEQLKRQRINSACIPTIQRSSNVFVRLSITGLRNMGNTCYINSMIQCLFATSKFRDIFLNNQFEDFMNANFHKTKLSPSLSLLFKKMYLNGACSIVPSAFLKSCVHLRPDLKIPSEQQDTQEFLMFLLDHLHDELSNSNVVVNSYPDLMNHDYQGDEYEKWFETLVKQGLSPVTKYFQGQLQDSLECQNCGFKSTNYSTFYMLSLNIPKLSPHGHKLKKVNLEDCIRMFTQDELLTGDNSWDCPKCSKPKAPNSASGDKERKHRHHRFLGSGFKLRGRSSSPAFGSNERTSTSPFTNGKGKTKKKPSQSIKSLRFVVLPPILIIHLSRFLFYDTSHKDTTVVTYPLILEIDHKGKTARYKLYGVVNHTGTLKSGHYTSIANKNLDHDLMKPDWYYFDDEVVKHTNHGSYNGTDQTHMSNSEVYVLFYERIDD